jgi:esterase/lipase
MHPIILLHGALGVGSDLSSLSAGLAKAGMDSRVFTFPGHGTAPFSTDFGIAGFADALHNFISDHGLQKAHMFGYSMGGYVALYHSAIHGLGGNIITLGTKFNWTEETVVKETQALNPRIMEAKMPAFAAMLREKHADSDKLLLKTAAMMEEIGRHQFLNGQTFSAISNRVLVCRGESDRMVTQEESKYAVNAMPNAMFREISDTRHQLESANLELLANTIYNFCNGETNASAGSAAG